MSRLKMKMHFQRVRTQKSNEEISEILFEDPTMAKIYKYDNVNDCNLNQEEKNNIVSFIRGKIKNLKSESENI